MTRLGGWPAGESSWTKSGWERTFADVQSELKTLSNIPVVGPGFKRIRLCYSMLDGDIVERNSAARSLGVDALLQVLTSGAGSLLSKYGPRAFGAAERSGTVWDAIMFTQPLHAGTAVPKSFELAVDGGKFWAHPNATKHMAEYT